MLHPDDLVAEVKGEIESDGGVLVIRRIHVRYRLRVPEDAHEAVERVRAVHANKCPVARTLVTQLRDAGAVLIGAILLGRRWHIPQRLYRLLIERRA